MKPASTDVLSSVSAELTKPKRPSVTGPREPVATRGRLLAHHRQLARGARQVFELAVGLLDALDNARAAESPSRLAIADLESALAQALLQSDEPTSALEHIRSATAFYDSDTDMYKAGLLMALATYAEVQLAINDIDGALRSAELAEETGLAHDRIVISTKVSTVRKLIYVYREIARRCDYPLHLGLTEAGLGNKGIVATTAGLAPLLLEGIGDTIRCGPTTSTFFQEMAEDITGYIREHMPVWRKEYPGVEEMEVAVMGCVVNGPGESKYANIGISLPGTFEEPKAPVYIDGEHATTLKGEGLVDEFKEILLDYIRKSYGREPAGTAADS